MNEEGNKVSVIIPVHNGGKYLSRCLDSLVKQTLETIEVIVIDDGSTDATWEIMIKYQNMFPHIIRIDKNEVNVGTGSTRNVGLSLATGKYIIFVDSDDWVSECFCEELLKKAVEEQADVVYCTAHQVDADGKVIFAMIPPYLDMDLRKAENRRKVFVAGIHNTIAYWNQLVRREIYLDTGYQAMEGAVFNEDYMLTCIPFLCQKIAVLDVPLYFQEKRMDSVFYCERKKFNERLRAADCVIKQAVSLGIFENNRDEWEYLYIVMTFLNAVPEFLNRTLYNVFPVELMQQAVAKIKGKFPDFMNNKYLLFTPFEQSVRFLRMFCKGTETFYNFYYGNYAQLNNVYTEKIVRLVKGISGKKIAIWGAGLKGQAFLLKKHQGVNENIKWIIDKNENLLGEKICDIPIVSFDMVKNDVEIILVMNYNHFVSIKNVIDMKAGTFRISIINFEEYLLYGID